jgi:hypothetical protein
VLVRDRQRIAIETIAGPEVPLEVCSPEVIGPVRRRRHDPRVRVVASAPPLLDQPLPGQEVARRARGWHLQLGVPALQPVQDLLRTPAGMLPSPGADRRSDVGRDAVRAMVRSPASLAQPVRPLPFVARDPLVASLPTDPVALAQLDPRVQLALPVRDEPHPLVHGCRLPPRHALLLGSSLGGGVTHVPGSMCYLCTRFVPTGA